MAADAIKTQSILFPNNNSALAVFPTSTNHPEEIVAALDIKPYKALLLILGGAASVDDKLIPRLTQLFGRGVARAAAETDAVIIDGGTKAGVMALMGEGVAGRGYKSVLLGVAPVGKVTYPGDAAAGVELEPNHSHFVLVEGNDWGSETATMYNLLRVLTHKTTVAAHPQRKPRQPVVEKGPSQVPGLAILAGGGPISKDEVLRAVRHNLPVIVVEGSGGLADDVAAAWKQRETLPDDPVMAEIIADGKIHLHLLSNPVKAVERLIIRELGVDKVLTQAWEVFADYDLNAKLQQKRFGNLQLAILIVGVVGTALAIGQQIYAPHDDKGDLLQLSLTQDATATQIGWWLLRHVLIIVPILLTVLVTAVNRFKQGSKWLLLRAGAESIKREIYRYRARSKPYNMEGPEQQLAQRVEDFTRRTMRTEVNASALVPYDKDHGFPPDMFAAQGGDDGFSDLTPDRYVDVRLGDQLRYFRKKAVTLEKQLKGLYWLTFIIGGVGTYLAAVGQQVWIALTTALVAAIGTYLGYRQTESTLTKYNQAATDLANVRAWWDALSAEDQSRQDNIDSLVDHTEQVLQSELDGWVQQMQNALAELRKAQEPVPEREENRERQRPIPPPDHAAAQGEPGASGDPANGKAMADSNPHAEIDGGTQPTGRDG